MYQTDPLEDGRWRRLVERHPRASIFHTPEWLECLRRTYHYTPIAFTSSPPAQELENGIVFCLVDSWLTGRRLVSVPFADHCDLLADHLYDLSTELKTRYIEIRPLVPLSNQSSFKPSRRFYHHSLDLRPGPDALFSRFHKDCVQRKIRRAEREGLEYKEGTSEPLLRDLYKLVMRTRRRQGLVPQPAGWFRNLAHCLGSAMQIRLAYQQNRPVAAIVTLIHKYRMVYKYGCSDERFNSLGGTQMLFWKAIQEGCSLGLLELDIGRTDYDDNGLVAFKERWGSSRTDLQYWRSREYMSSKAEGIRWPYLRKALEHTPRLVLRAAGELLYRHMG
jgi:hypothetical protein